MPELPADLTARVARLLPRLASDHDGEIVATAAAITRTLKAAGHDLHDLAAHLTAPPRTVIVYREHQARAPDDTETLAEMVARCLDAGDERLSEWESAFLTSLAQQLARGRRASAKQSAVVAGVAARLRGD